MNKVSKKFNSDVYLSVVIPIYNERESIGKLYRELEKTLTTMNLKYEVLLIDDGSTDGTFDELIKINNKNKLFKIISFRKNFGQTSAISAGFDFAEGKMMI